MLKKWIKLPKNVQICYRSTKYLLNQTAVQCNLIKFTPGQLNFKTRASIQGQFQCEFSAGQQNAFGSWCTVVCRVYNLSISR